jgi:RNA polymerase sigma-70 factor (ECF subfamily)
LADKARRERIISIDYTQDLETLDVLADEVSPEHRYGAREELRRISDAFDQLSDNFRAVIWLRRVEGLSQKDTAERLGINEGTLESRLCRALKALADGAYHNEFAGVAPTGGQPEENEVEYGQRRE